MLSALSAAMYDHGICLGEKKIRLSRLRLETSVVIARRTCGDYQKKSYDQNWIALGNCARHMLDAHAL